PLWNFGLEFIWNQKFAIFGSKSAPRCPPPVLAFLPHPRHCRCNKSLFWWRAARGRRTSLGTCFARPWRDRILPTTSYIQTAPASASIARCVIVLGRSAHPTEL